MALPERHVLTIEGIADRWRVDAARVKELVYTRQLPQAYLISGPARLEIRDASGTRKCYPNPRREAVDTRIVVSTSHTITNTFHWPLSRVRRIYEFDAKDSFGRLSLLQYCHHDQAQQTGWAIDFDRGRTVVEGGEHAIVELGDLLAFESRCKIGVASEKQRQSLARLRDTCKQRCRVAAAIIWSQDPAMTLPQVYRHDWTQVIACEGRPPTEKVFRTWVKDLNPNRSPGRRTRSDRNEAQP